jgi:hypothetical protein
MKNIHILGTDKPSRLALQLDCKPCYNLQLSKIADNWTINWQKQNIYITSDEEIKKGDWFITTDTNEIHKSDWIKFHFNNGIKIILTTDQDLIKDGIQAIDDEFLEWFVNNPSCEEVEINYDSFEKTGNISIWEYEIIIPKEEPKQDLEKEMFELEQELDIPSHLRWHNSKPKQTVEEYEQQGLEKYSYELKQETLEEAAEKYAISQGYSEKEYKDPNSLFNEISRAVRIGAKWQQEQIGDSKFLQRLRATKSDAEARRLIFEQFKNK